jgi:hypothetical protein
MRAHDQGAYVQDFAKSLAESRHAFALQCLTISPTGVLGLSEPSPVLVGWDKDRLP